MNDPQDIQVLLQEGIRRHQTGQLPEAETVYRRILDFEPDHADANHMLGVIALQVGNHDLAVQLITKAIRTNPRAAAYHCNLGNALHEQGLFEEAAASQRKAIDLNPEYAMAHNNLGNAQKALGKLEDAVASYRKAIAIKPYNAQALSNLGLTLIEMGRLEDAVDSYEAALRINPDLFGIHVKLALVLKEMGCLDEAIGHYRQAITAQPEDPGIHIALGNVLYEKNQLDEAAYSFQKALSINPDYAEGYSSLGTVQLKMDHPKDAAESCRKALARNPAIVEAHNNLGIALKRMDRPEEAEVSYRKALEIKPDYAEALNNLGSLLLDQGHVDEPIDYFYKAIAADHDYAEPHSSLGPALELKNQLKEAADSCRRALALEPDHRQAHINLSMILLRMGQLKEGWGEYEWRNSIDRARTDFPQLQWDGSDLDGRRIILWGEQGIGDEVRFASIISDVLETGAAVSIECDKRLVEIFARSFANATVHARPYGGATANPGQFDFQCPFAGLARFFRPDQKSFPTDRPGYLKANPGLMKFWKKRLSDISHRPKVGLSWSSAVRIPKRNLIYASIEELAPILNLDGVDFINLQSHESSEDITEARDRYGVDIFSWEDLDLRNDLNGVAALTSCLDLVISFPTFSSEFAGALGVPTLCFVSHKENLDQLGTEDAIWYPHTHYVSKNSSEPWHVVLEKIAEIVRTKLGL